MDIDPDVAKRMFLEGATLVILNLPLNTEFGIDLKSWNTGKKFRGVKMIPPGIHLVYYNGSNKYCDTAPRVSFFHNFQKSEMLVKKWDPDLEKVNSNGITKEDISRLKENLINLDPFLGAYPFEIWDQWKCLSNKITVHLLNRVNPECGVIRSALELVFGGDRDSKVKVKKRSGGDLEVGPSTSSATDGDNPPHDPELPDLSVANGDCEMPLHKDDGEKATAIDSDEGATHRVAMKNKKRRRTKGIEDDDGLLPTLKPVKGTEVRFTEIPESCFPEGATPAEITQHSLDLSFTLDKVISEMKTADEVIGELQMSFVCFLVGLSLESLEHWKRLVHLICRCEKAMVCRRSLYTDFLVSFECQLKHIPEDFLVDIVKSENTIYTSLREMFRAMLTTDQIEGRLRCAALRLQERITLKFGWEFDNLDLDDEEDAPVVVEIQGF